jgi:hypothetical protein
MKTQEELNKEYEDMNLETMRMSAESVRINTLKEKVRLFNEIMTAGIFDTEWAIKNIFGEDSPIKK